MRVCVCVCLLVGDGEPVPRHGDAWGLQGASRQKFR